MDPTKPDLSDHGLPQQQPAVRSSSHPVLPLIWQLQVEPAAVLPLGQALLYCCHQAICGPCVGVGVLLLQRSRASKTCEGTLRRGQHSAAPLFGWLSALSSPCTRLACTASSTLTAPVGHVTLSGSYPNCQASLQATSLTAHSTGRALMGPEHMADLCVWITHVPTGTHIKGRGGCGICQVREQQGLQGGAWPQQQLLPLCQVLVKHCFLVAGLPRSRLAAVNPKPFTPATSHLNATQCLDSCLSGCWPVLRASCCNNPWQQE